MSKDLPFELGNSYSEIPASESDKMWEIFAGQVEISDLLYRPDTFKGGEGPSKIYNVKGKTISNVSFARTNISNLNFTKCVFIDCIFIGAVFDNLEFHNCTFNNCNFWKCRIKDTYVDPTSFSKCLNIKKDANIGIHLFQQLMRNFKDLDQPDFYRSAEFMFRRFRRSETWYKVDKGKISRWKGYPLIFGNYLAQILLGYGLKIQNFLATTFVIFLIFWCVNDYLWGIFGLSTLCDVCTQGTWDESFYYTAVSLSNLGYGDIVPSTVYGRIWASAQSVVGAIWFAIMASMVFRQIISR